jgi:hypothetical protein
MARKDADPLPVFKVGGIVRLNQEDLDDWLSRQRARTMVTPVRTEEARDRLQLIA